MRRRPALKERVEQRIGEMLRKVRDRACLWARKKVRSKAYSTIFWRIFYSPDEVALMIQGQKVEGYREETVALRETNRFLANENMALKFENEDVRERNYFLNSSIEWYKKKTDYKF